MAVAIATCESGLKHTAFNGNNRNGSSDKGVWQINTVHDKTLAQMEIDPWNAEEATRFARYLYDQNGWRDWVCFTHKKVALAK